MAAVGSRRSANAARLKFNSIWTSLLEIVPRGTISELRALEKTKSSVPPLQAQVPGKSRLSIAKCPNCSTWNNS